MTVYKTKLHEELLLRVYEAFVLCDSPYPLVKMAAAIQEAFKLREHWQQFRDPEVGDVVAGVAYFRKGKSGDWQIYDRNADKWTKTAGAPIVWKSDLEMHDRIGDLDDIGRRIEPLERDNRERSKKCELDKN